MKPAYETGVSMIIEHKVLIYFQLTTSSSRIRGEQSYRKVLLYYQKHNVSNYIEKTLPNNVNSKKSKQILYILKTKMFQDIHSYKDNNSYRHWFI